MKRLLPFCALLFSGTLLYAQQFGGFAPRTRWMQLNTDTARIIYQPPTAAQAQRVAALVHRMAAESPVKLGGQLQKINIVLHANTTLANGYVALGPFRSEYYMLPGSDLFAQGTIPYPEQLALHEYRHVQQYNNMNRGLARAFGLVLGQQGRALANAIAIPNWLFEGDAVYAETAFTPQGRGRLPYFTSGPVSIWEANRRYSLMKWMNGSLRDYVPNHYQFGYLLTNYGYQRYGADFWKNVIADASAFRGLPTPLRSAVRRHAGTSFRRLAQDAFEHYQQQWPAEQKPEVRSLVRHQLFGQAIGTDSLLYLESSYRQLPHFVLEKGNGKRKKWLRNLSSEDWIGYRNGTIAYTAYATHPRWSLTDYSNIVLLDLASGKQRTLTRGRRYFTPDISPSGGKVAAIFADPSARTRIHILDAATGRLLQELTIGEGTAFFHPRFITENKLVAVHRRRNGSVAMHLWNLDNHTNERLFYAGFNTLGYPMADKDLLYFSCSASGSDDVYTYHLGSGEIRRLTGTNTANYFGSAKGDSLLYTSFTANGLQLRTARVQGMPVPPTELAASKVRFAVAGDSINLLQTGERYFDTALYRKSTGLVQVHSWRPFYEDPEFTFTAYSNNILNTLDARAFYRYNQNERSHGLGGNIAYSGWFPILTGGMEYTFNRNIRTPRSNGQFRQLELRGGYYVPLNLTQGRTFKLLRWGQNLVFNQLTPVVSGQRGGHRRVYMQHQIGFSQYLPMARQHIVPRLGYVLAPSYRHQMWGAGYQMLLNAQVFLPSIRNHGLVLSGSVQHTDTGLVLFSNRFANARGYADHHLPRMWRASANYHFPIAYPDRGLAGLVYLLRLRANVFYDHSAVRWPGRINRRWLRSTGTELFLDLKLLNQLPAALGIRYSYLLDEGFGNGKRHHYAVVLPVNLIPE